jgi:hypothetical protein
MRFPDHDLSIAILGNLAELQPSLLARRVADVVLADVLTGAPTAAPAARDEEPRAVEIDPKVYARYLGHYEVDGERFRFHVRGSGLWVRTPQGEDLRLVARSETRYAIPERGIAVVFVADAQGRYATIEVTTPVKEVIGQRVAAPDVDPAELEGLAGRYRSDELDVVYHLALVGDTLEASVGYAPVMVLLRDPSGAWRGEGLTLRFERDGEGRPAGFRLDGPRVKHLAFRREGPLPDPGGR